MKVLYIASNALGESELRLEHDVTELQRVAAQASGDPVEFAFFPALPFEDIEQIVATLKPDVVHISAHGGPDELMLANSAEKKVKLTAEALRALLAAHVPRLVYINACTSEQLALSLSTFVPYAIGTSAPITNFAARKSAVTFYRCLLRGQNLQEAYDAAKATVQTLSDAIVVTKLFPEPVNAASREYFHRVPTLVAHFENHNFRERQDGYNFRLGLVGASDTTTQTIFCTDDESFENYQSDDPHFSTREAKLSEIVRTNAVGGEVWTDGCWEDINGDFRLYALGITAAGRCYSASGTLCEALTQFYRVHYDTPDGSVFPEDLQMALAVLRENDGSLFRVKSIGRPRSRAKRKTPKQHGPSERL